MSNQVSLKMLWNNSWHFPGVIFFLSILFHFMFNFIQLLSLFLPVLVPRTSFWSCSLCVWHYTIISFGSVLNFWESFFKVTFCGITYSCFSLWGQILGHSSFGQEINCIFPVQKGGRFSNDFFVAACFPVCCMYSGCPPSQSFHISSLLLLSSTFKFCIDTGYDESLTRAQVYLWARVQSISCVFTLIYILHWCSGCYELLIAQHWFPLWKSLFSWRKLPDPD